MRALILGISLLALAAPVGLAHAQTAPTPMSSTTQDTESFLVFFDWDDASLTPEARQIIASAVGQYDATGMARITIIGHTDLSGPADYNQKLSERRAAAVVDALVSLGVPADVITAFGEGETNPLVPTADGVREPQNRRVEIIMPVAAPPAPAPMAPPPVVQAPPPPPERLPFAVGLGVWYGYNLKETDTDSDKTSHLVGPQLTAEYAVTPNITIGADVAGYNTLDTSADDGNGLRASGLLGYQWNLGSLHPHIGAHAGYITGKGVQDGFLTGPNIGVKYDLSRSVYLFTKAAYDIIPWRNSVDQGIVNGSVGAGLRF